MSEQDNASATAATATPRPACQNCGVPLLGEHCYACGQPTKGLVRHFGSIVGDFLDTVFNIDARVFRTLWPLFARPGFLSREYFEGHRIRFVSPVRLFVFLSIVTFFVAQLTLDFGSTKFDVDGNDSGISAGKTVKEVQERRDAALKELNKAKVENTGTPGVGLGLDAAANAIKSQADRRIKQLEDARKAGTPPPPPQGGMKAGLKGDDSGDNNISFNDKGPWDPVKNPIDIPWAPNFVNRKFNELAGHAKDNIARMQHDPNLFKDAALRTVPSTLFVLMPIFALMLKIIYAFKRRLYMEHLIVSLHSHAFLCLSLLLMFLVMAAQDAMAPRAQGLFHLLETALWIWMPVYLFLMQKRVYGQGWTMTLLKYCILGFCYFVLLSLGAAFTLLASLVWM